MARCTGLRGLPLLVAVHAGRHFCGSMQRDTRLGLYFSVAIRADGFGGRVAGVAEEYEIRKAVDALRWDRGLAFAGVASAARRPGREAGALLLRSTLVAEGTGKIDTRVTLMGEDRVGRRHGASGADQEQENESGAHSFQSIPQPVQSIHRRAGAHARPRSTGGRCRALEVALRS